MTMYGRPSAEMPAWYTVTIAGCADRWASTSASALNMRTSSGSAAGAGMTLTATARRGMSCSYRKTSANPPEPSGRT